MKIRNQLLLNYGVILGLMLVVAAKAMAENRQEYLDAGAGTYMSNTVDKDQRLHAIEALLLAKSNRQELGRTA